MNLCYVLDIHVVISLGFHCISYKNHIMSPPLYYAELFNPVKKKTHTASRDTAAAPVPPLAFFLLIRITWTNLGEGKPGLKVWGGEGGADSTRRGASFCTPVTNPPCSAGSSQPSPAASPEAARGPVVKHSSRSLSGEAGILLGHRQDSCRSQAKQQRRHKQMQWGEPTFSYATLADLY